MANAVNVGTQKYTKPYLTLQEYKDAPSGTSVSSLIKGGNQLQQDAALATAILRGSNWIDEWCKQPLWARLKVEKRRVTAGRDGLNIHPDCFPLTQLVSLSYGYDPSLMITLTDCSVAWLEDRKITVSPLYVGNWNGLQDRRNLAGRIYAQYSYVHGFVNTTILACTTGATSVIPVDLTGITAGSMIRIIDGASSEDVQVSSSYVYGTATVALTNPLIYAHATGVSFSAMPSGIKEAAVLATSVYLKQRGDGAMSMGSGSQPTKPGVGAGTGNPTLDLAADFLTTFVRRF